ncbi:MAG: hypothetical protein AAF939_14880 [Planctomycetota bacterium]
MLVRTRKRKIYLSRSSWILWLVLIFLTTLVQASDDENDVHVPITDAALQHVQAVRKSMPNGWQYLGRVTPIQSGSGGPSLLGIGMETLDREFIIFDEVQPYLKPLGARWVRLQSGWNKTESKPGVFDFAWLDKIVDGCVEAGLEPWLQLSYGNTNYPEAGGIGLSTGLIKSKEGFEAWERYTTRVVRRYRDRVDRYEVWNEPYGSWRQHKQDEIADLYYELYLRTAQIIRREDPGAQIFALGLAAVGKHDHFAGLIDRLKVAGGLEFLDGISFHGYATNPDDFFHHVSRMRTYLDIHAPHVALWQGENGAPSRRQSMFALKDQDWTELSQAKWNSRRALAHIGRDIPFTQFQISDMRYAKRADRPNFKGLLETRDDRTVIGPKLAYFSYQTVNALFPGSVQAKSTTRRIESNLASLATFRFQDSTTGRTRFALWNSAERPNESYQRQAIEVALPDFDAKEIVYIDVATGAVFEPPRGHDKTDLFRRFGDLIVIRGLPIWDSPIVLADRSDIKLIK